MSARNPTTFNRFVNVLNLRTGETIKTTEPSQVVDDQMFVLDKAELVALTVFQIIESNDASFTDKLTIYCECKDMCGVDGVTSDEITCTPYVLASIGSGTGSIRLTSGATSNNTSTIALSSSTIQWLQGDSINLETNGIENTITMAMMVNGGGAEAKCFGIAIFADET